MKHEFFLFVLFSFLFISCQNQEQLNNNEFDFVYNKTQISFNESTAIVKTDNVKSDFFVHELVIGNNVYIENNLLKSRTNQSIWFIPFDKTERPTLLNRGLDPTISIDCNCSTGTVGDCDTEETTSGGTTTIVCNGGCTNPNNGGSGECGMTVTITDERSLYESISINGVLMSTNSVIFNNIKYDK